MDVKIAHPPPRMVTHSDIHFVRELATSLTSKSIVVEFGPWLGALTVELAGHCDLHAVDSFIWTKSHDKKVPDMVRPGDSFRLVFEGILKERGLTATLHEVEFGDFQWEGGKIDLVVIDAPKTANELSTCLSRVMPHLKSGGRILIKHGSSTIYADMVLYIEELLTSGVLTLPKQRQDKDCSTVLLGMGKNSAAFSDVDASLERRATTGVLQSGIDLAPGHPLRFLPVFLAALNEDWRAALRALSEMNPNRDLVSTWDKIEARLAKKLGMRDELAVLSEMVAVHHGTSQKVKLPAAFHVSETQALRGFWINNAANPWRAEAFAHDIIARAHAFGYLSWPSKVRDIVAGKDILDVGCGPGLHGIGFLAAGAKSYMGLDPILKPDSDRVKNLTAKSKEPFGWTPTQISEQIAPWRVSPLPIAETPEKRNYDLATLHNVTEHLQDLERIFKDIAVRLRKGGKILYNHHNFYSWNGHHLAPKVVADINPTIPEQLEMLNWAHVEYEPDAEHYISRGLNRIRLDALIEITERYFDIELIEEIPSRPETGAGRLTDEIRKLYPYLEDRDFLTQNLFCIATVKI